MQRPVIFFWRSKDNYLSLVHWLGTLIIYAMTKLCVNFISGKFTTHNQYNFHELQ
jgi:hypothetical protein